MEDKIKRLLKIERRFHDALERVVGSIILMGIALDVTRIIIVSPWIYEWRDAVLISGNAGAVELLICDFIQWLHNLQPYLRLVP